MSLNVSLRSRVEGLVVCGGGEMVDLLGLTVLWMTSRDLLLTSWDPLFLPFCFPVTKRWTTLLCHRLIVTMPQTKAADPCGPALNPLELCGATCDTKTSRAEPSKAFPLTFLFQVFLSITET